MHLAVYIVKRFNNDYENSRSIYLQLFPLSGFRTIHSRATVSSCYVDDKVKKDTQLHLYCSSISLQVMMFATLNDGYHGVLEYG